MYPPPPTGCPEVPLEEYKANLRQMAAHIRAVHPEARVMFIAPPPIHEVRRPHRRARGGRPLLNALRVDLASFALCSPKGALFVCVAPCVSGGGGGGCTSSSRG